MKKKIEYIIFFKKGVREEIINMNVLFIMLNLSLIYGLKNI